MAEIDDIFLKYAQEAEAESKKSNSKGTSFKREFEDIHWCGLEQNRPKVIRVIGNPPDVRINPEVDKYTARTVTMATLIGDDGKKFKLIRPSFKENSNYIINKIINKVDSVKWTNGEKTFPVKEAHPEIYNLIEKNGLDEKDPQAKFERGWKGREVIIMNVIDREQMDWHRENKHTLLLAKSVREKDGNVYVEEGISSFAAQPKIVQLFKYYNSWEKYDIAITKTGDMKNAFIIDNATKNPERVPECAEFISNLDHLTDEEKSWEKYDLDKLYRVTTYTKIYNRLKNTIRKIDRALGTSYLDEIEREVEKEKKLFAEIYKDEESSPSPIKESVVENEDLIPQAAPSRVRETPKVSGAVGSEMPYYATLSDVLKGKIVSCKKGSRNGYELTWDSSLNDSLAQCPECGTVAPLECTCCPACNLQF